MTWNTYLHNIIVNICPCLHRRFELKSRCCSNVKYRRKLIMQSISDTLKLRSKTFPIILSNSSRTISINYVNNLYRRCNDLWEHRYLRNSILINILHVNHMFLYIHFTEYIIIENRKYYEYRQLNSSCILHIFV